MSSEIKNKFIADLKKSMKASLKPNEELRKEITEANSKIRNLEEELRLKLVETEKILSENLVNSTALLNKYSSLEKELISERENSTCLAKDVESNKGLIRRVCELMDQLKETECKIYNLELALTNKDNSIDRLNEKNDRLIKIERSLRLDLEGTVKTLNDTRREVTNLDGGTGNLIKTNARLVEVINNLELELDSIKSRQEETKGTGFDKPDSRQLLRDEQQRTFRTHFQQSIGSRQTRKNQQRPIITDQVPFGLKRTTDKPSPMFSGDELDRLAEAIGGSKLPERNTIFRLLEVNLPKLYKGNSFKPKKALLRVGLSFAGYFNLHFRKIEVEIGYKKSLNMISIEVNNWANLSDYEREMIEEAHRVLYFGGLGSCLVGKKG